MFTGLIREIGEVVATRGEKLQIKSSLNPKIGDSIAVNGVCLTVTDIFKDSFMVEVADETRSIIPEEKFRGLVHLEPAMQMGDRFEGHIVQGHIDTIGKISSISKGENGISYSIEIDSKKSAFTVPKGSVTIDGISLTINWNKEGSFGVTIIPHTHQNTLFKSYKIGTLLNIETDLFARYIEHILEFKSSQKKAHSWSELESISMGY